MPQKPDHDYAALLALLLAAYMLSAGDVRTMSAALATGYLVSMQAAYQEAASTVGSSDGQNWTPSQDDQQTAQTWAEAQAAGIAATYASDLKGAITTFLDTWQKEKGNLQGAQQAATTILGQWAQKRAAWKSQQVSNYSCGSGGQAGTDAFLVDLEGGYLIDTETGEAIAIGDYAIAVLPETSSNDLCRDFAGYLFDISEDDAIPDFPIHGNCPHEKVLVMV